MKYKRPNRDPELVKRAIVTGANDFVDVIQRHLQIRLEEEHKLLMKLCRRQKAEDYIKWCEETRTRNSHVYSTEVKRYFSANKTSNLDLESDEGKYILGKRLLDGFITRKRREVVELRKALGLELRNYSNKSIPITSRIENSELFRLFGSPLYLEELKANYKKAAKKLHPDVGGSEEDMQALSKAYKFLLNNWEQYSPQNLAIELDKLKKVKSMRFDHAALRSLMDF